MENGIAGTITVIEDVSERVAKESELSTAREEAEKANRAKDALLATLSHDLRTPLGSILGWIRLVRERPGDVELIERAAKTIESSARVQVQLIEQILDVSRVASGKVEFRPEDADLASIVDSAIEVLAPVAESKEVHIEKQIPAEFRTSAVDAKRIHQIVWNLLSNAIKFTPRKGTVRVSLQFSTDGARLQVADTGIGIAPEHLSRVFDPLWQAKTSSGQGGLGLGLAITKELVELHGGSIAAVSAGLGKGTTFTVDFPELVPAQKQQSR